MPMDRSKYPPNWEEISHRVRFERAEGRCECEGECGNDHLAENAKLDRRCFAYDKGPHPITGSRVVLTTAHLDQDPSSDDESRMRAMCQRCHLTYDAKWRRDGGVAQPLCSEEFDRLVACRDQLHVHDEEGDPRPNLVDRLMATVRDGLVK